jgi:Ca-activated chloride channel family protein
MQFAAPLWLLLTALPLLLAGLAWLLRGRRRTAVPIALWDLVAAVPHTWRERLRHGPAILRALALALLAVAMAGPLVVRRDRTTLASGLDIMLVIDASGSMLALDLAPDRFGAARRFAEALIAGRPDDRFGLMTFAGRAAGLCPVTSDRQALAEGLRDARAGTEELNEGTALGAALVRATERLGNARDGAPGGVIVLLSDGASNRGRITPREAAGLAARRGVRIYAIGLGLDGSVKYPTEAGILDVALPVQEAALREIAQTTGGRYWRATSSEGLPGVSAAFDRLEHAGPMVVDRQTIANLFAPLVVAALLCVVADMWLAALLRILST